MAVKVIMNKLTWQTKKLGDVVMIIDGTHQTPKYVEKGIPFYSVENITSNNFSDTKFISEYVYAKEPSNRKIIKNDILMTRIGDIGTAKLVDWDVKAAFYVSLALIRCNRNKVLPEYLTQVINSSTFKKEVLSKSLLVAFPNKINLGDIGNCKISIPDLAEQERIVGILEVWDDYLEKLERKIQIEEALLKQILKSVLLNKEREFCRLDGKVFVKKGKALLSSQVVKGKYPVIAGGKSSPYYHNKYTDENVVTVSASGANAGFVSYHPEKIWASDYSVVYGDGENSTTEYLYYALKAVQNNIYHHQSGGAQPHVYPKDILAQKIWLPSIGEQKKIASVFTDLDMKINILKSKKHQIQQQKKFLLKNLVSGMIRTPEDILEKGVN